MQHVRFFPQLEKSRRKISNARGTRKRLLDLVQMQVEGVLAAIRTATQRGGPLKNDAARTMRPDRIMKAVPKASHTEREGFWHGSTEMSRHIAKPDHTGRTLGA